MDALTFDRLTRSLTASPSRRTLSRLLGGILLVGPWNSVDPDAEAKKRKKRKKKKKCKGGKKKCGKKCFDLQTDSAHCGSCGNACEESEVCLDGICGCPVDESACGGACCAPESCIDGACCPASRTCGTVCCAAQELCADPETELCVVGQGTCDAGVDSCGGNLVTCNDECGCFQSTSGATRCGAATLGSDCGQCTTDADCEVALSVPGAFCAKFFGGPCLCGEGENSCFVPCPSDPP